MDTPDDRAEEAAAVRPDAPATARHRVEPTQNRERS
jgi:hypothetical protein